VRSTFCYVGWRQLLVDTFGAMTTFGTAPDRFAEQACHIVQGHVHPSPDGTAVRLSSLPADVWQEIGRDHPGVGLSGYADPKLVATHLFHLDREEAGRLFDPRNSLADLAEIVIELTAREDPPHPLSSDDERFIEYTMELVRLEKAGERATLVIGPYTAITMIGLLQMATRHPGMAGQMRQIVADIIEQLAPLFAGTPGEEMIRRGGHPEFDVDQEPRSTFTCPKCGITSHNPNDLAAGYCGNCHDFTGGAQ
jgi:hypothetical protein